MLIKYSQNLEIKHSAEPSAVERESPSKYELNCNFSNIFLESHFAAT